MINLSLEQLAALENLARLAFHSRVVALLRDRMRVPETTTSHDQLMSFVSEGDKRASAIGIRADSGVIRFISLSILGGRWLDEVPEVARQLESAGPEKREAALAHISQLFAASGGQS